MEIQKLKDQPANDAILYHYLTIDKLIDILINCRLPLTRLNLFDDKLEGITLQHLDLNFTSTKNAKDAASILGEPFDEIPIVCDPIKRNSLRKQRIDFQKFNYANCWFVSDYESVAMWKLYSRPDSVAIRIPYLSLIEQIENKAFKLSGEEEDHERIRFGNTKYYKFDDLNDIRKLADENKENQEDIQGFLKDNSFEHEKEFRIMLSIKQKEDKKAEPKPAFLYEQIEDINNLIDLKAIYFKMLNFCDMPFDIIFHPQSLSWHSNNIKVILKKYDLSFQINESVLKRIFNI